MNRKRSLAGICSLWLLTFLLLLPVLVQAAEQGNGQSTTLTTSVPDTHTVLLEIEGQGSVTVGDVTYNKASQTVSIPRLAEQKYEIKPSYGYGIDTVLYGTTNLLEPVNVEGNSFTAPPIYSNDNILKVSFRRTSSGITYYTLTFNTNGGSSISSVTYSSGSVVALSGYKPTREGCEFAGWYAEAELKTPVTEVVLNSNKTVYAAWTVPGLPDGTIAKPDGSFETPDGIIIKPDGTVELPDGTVITPDAEGNKPMVDKEGNVTTPDGTVYKPDGTIHNADGSIQDGTGTYLLPGKGIIDRVTVTGNRVNTYLMDEAAGAQGYDYVIGTSADMLKTKDYYIVNKNQLKTDTSMYYVEKGTYYAACHAWVRGADGKKVFGPWSELEAFEVTSITPETPKIAKVKVSGRTVTVTYTKCKNAAGYDIVLGDSVKKVNGELRPVDYGKRVKKITNGNTVTVTFRNCPKGTYYAGLHAYNRTSEDGKKVFSPWSNRKKVTIR